MPGSIKSSKSSRSPSRCSADSIGPLHEEDISTPPVRPPSSGSAKVLSAGENPSSVNLTNPSSDDASLRRKQSTGETNNQPTSSSTTTTAGTSSGNESAAVLNLRIQSSGLETDPKEGIPLKDIGVRSSSRPPPLVINRRNPLSNYGTCSEPSPDELPPTPTIIAADIHEPPKETPSKKRWFKNVVKSAKNEGTSSGTEIPGTSSEIPPEPTDLSRPQPSRSQSDLDIIETKLSPEHTAPAAQSTSVSVISAPPKKLPGCFELASKIYVKIEPFVWLITLGLLIGFLLSIKLAYDRNQLDGHPLYSYRYNQNRPRCAEKQFYHPLNCLRKNETQFLNNKTFYKQCVSDMKLAFSNEFCIPSKHSSYELYGQAGGLIHGEVFFNTLTNSNDSTNVHNFLKYITCVRIFETNPFGEVRVQRSPEEESREAIIQSNFSLKNYKLMTECNIIPSDSSFEYFFNNLTNVIRWMIWVSGIATLGVFICGFIRFHRNAQRILETSPSRVPLSPT